MPNLEDGLWLCKRGDKMTQREAVILEEARDGSRLMRVTALQMVMIKTLQWLSTTTKIPASYWGFQTLHSDVHVPYLLLQPHLSSRYQHKSHLSDLVSTKLNPVSLFHYLSLHLNSLPSSVWPSQTTLVKVYPHPNTLNQDTLFHLHQSMCLFHLFVSYLQTFWFLEGRALLD